eukprot:SAG11_NODE_3730_length_2258_cov_4.563687_1_plen_303_part_00
MRAALARQAGAGRVRADRPRPRSRPGPGSSSQCTGRAARRWRSRGPALRRPLSACLVASRLHLWTRAGRARALRRRARDPGGSLPQSAHHKQPPTHEPDGLRTVVHRLPRPADAGAKLARRGGAAAATAAADGLLLETEGQRRRRRQPCAARISPSDFIWKVVGELTGMFESWGDAPAAPTAPGSALCGAEGRYMGLSISVHVRGAAFVRAARRPRMGGPDGALAPPRTAPLVVLHRHRPGQRAAAAGGAAALRAAGSAAALLRLFVQKRKGLRRSAGAAAAGDVRGRGHPCQLAYRFPYEI